MLFTAAHGNTWYGRWGYGFGRGGYNLQRSNWDAAAAQLHGAPLADVLHDFRDIDRAVVAIVRRYRVRMSAHSKHDCQSSQIIPASVSDPPQCTAIC